VTINPGEVLGRCWDRPVGRLVPGALADVTVIRRNNNGPVATQVVRAREHDVALVVVDGVPRYGDKPLMSAVAPTGAFAVTVGGSPRLVALPSRPARKRGGQPSWWTWSTIRAELQAVMNDPAKAVKQAEAQRAAHAGPLDAADAPLILSLDMPGGRNAGFAGRPKDFTKVVFGPMPTLEHDERFFDEIEAATIHGGLLSNMRGFYS
jgi:5-methylthioadenosine/S-adenosylhomocysteine deaminase